jgi:hypothetical protein
VPDPVDRILAAQNTLDEFDFDILLERLAGLRDEDAHDVIDRLPWKVMTPSQVIRLFHSFHNYHQWLGKHVSLNGFGATELIHLLEGLDQSAVKILKPSLKQALESGQFTIEDLEFLVAPYHTDLLPLLLSVNLNPDIGLKYVLSEFREGSKRRREIILYSCVKSDFFPEFFAEVWGTDSNFVKHQVNAFPTSRLGSFLLSAAGGCKPRVIESTKKIPDLDFGSKEVNELFNSLNPGKKKAVIASLVNQEDVPSRTANRK